MIGLQIIKDATGDYPVYPGHPLVIAYEIISVFPGPGEAFATHRASGMAHPNAISDSRISGGGREVRIACDLLRGAQQGMAAEELIVLADQHWKLGLADGYRDATELGLVQAAKLKHEFPIKLAAWLAHDRH